ncbi:ABC-type phosphate/phosphonate transport system, substrate-binding protein [Nitrosomonas cryotolerans]|uniref:ABC-type phosphate/phosphonate transport system, substrate-binding protein n=1 Tax=Nitrosomonas cryotolerans ATCC 49181 TaxID=1131553 RepID=A0A1N6HSG0_9PROT|nr:PhnD/SsuA/transferrin family substrate-binding protein [Nitrosomonas cryotolerans]SFP95745.1 ABC-type phosphate/phosphonate transport system, substrate-binding protein [Nitrosomonas cryotolerans]SIO22702.1 ABC-type phosphate/phosphonate transport system, substrate-binding protein [Nitrosomonas cryotolerans ATCC 49181]
MSNTLLIGAVAYDPKVITIWDGFQKWFAAHGFDLDYILYSNYERQVAGQFAGHYHVAWNSPLAWLQTERIAARVGRQVEALAMRDTDCDLTSVIVVRSDSSIDSIEALRGKTVAVGASDSPQASLIPLIHLAEAGLEPGKDFTVRPFDVLVGKHGDHIGGERDAAKALIEGTVDAACMIDGNHLLFSKEGTLSSGSTRILAQTDEYDHCNFTVLDGPLEDTIMRFRELLLSMSYDDPTVRSLLDLEGLKVWKPGRTEKYALLARAIDRFGTVDAFVTKLSKQCA